jgi:hypothetical protein
MIGRLMAPLLVAGAMAACSGSHSKTGQGSDATVGDRSIEEVLAAHTDSLLALPGVVGTAIASCEGEPCIKVLLADAHPDTKRRIPQRLEGYPVVAEVTGTIRPR